MTARRLIGRVLLATLAVGVATPARAQDSLARVKGFYASAAYEEALQVLEELRRTAPPTGAAAAEVSAYQIFCLVALGRTDEATLAIAATVRADPLFRPSQDQTSPRVLAFFDSVRRPLLPDVIKATYARAKDAYDRKEMASAAEDFDRVITLVNEMAPPAGDSVLDLRTLAAGFRDLSRAAIPPPAPAAPPPPPAAPPPPPQPRVYNPSDKDVTAPVAVSRSMPPWAPLDSFEGRMQYSGVLELVIGEDGQVLTAAVTESVQIRYDPVLLKAALTWRFKPATLNGQPVRYRFPINIRLTK